MSDVKTCAAFAPGTISDLIDGALTPFAAWRVRRHVRDCASCAAEFAAERRLQFAARTLHADAVPAAELRERAFAVLTSAPAPRRAPALTFAAIALSLTIIGGAGAALLLSARPSPAFAQVEKAMGNISTIRFTVKNSVYDVRTKKAIYYGGEDANRTEPPAIRNDMGPDDYRVEATQGVLRVRKAGRPLRVVYQIILPHKQWYVAGKDHDQAARLRRMMREELLTPQMPPEGAKNGPVHWIESEETVEGRRLLRFQLGVGAGKTERGERLTRTGYRQIIWADPETHRLTRALREYYDGKSHSIMDWTNFRYNESLPDSLFSLTPPKNAQLLK